MEVQVEDMAVKVDTTIQDKVLDSEEMGTKDGKNKLSNTSLASFAK
jgi:hypothetical protein